MRLFSLLFLAVFAASLPIQAGNATHRATAPHHSPTQGMVNTLCSMSLLLDAVRDKASADTAAPMLLELYRLFHAQQAAAEDMPQMNSRTLDSHLARMDAAMNAFRLACARVHQEKCYGSTQLGKAVKKVAQEF